MTAVWTPPITWVVDQLVTEADLNQQVRDNLEFLHAGLTGYILLRDDKAQGTNGGTFTSGAWRTRDLTVKAWDANGHASLSANQITLAAGAYRCRIICPVVQVNAHQARLYNVTAGAVTLLGSSNYAANSVSGAVSFSFIHGRFDIATPAVFEVQHRCATTQSANGFGQSANYDVETYTIAEFWKVA